MSVLSERDLDELEMELIDGGADELDKDEFLNHLYGF